MFRPYLKNIMHIFGTVENVKPCEVIKNMEQKSKIWKIVFQHSAKNKFG